MLLTSYIFLDAKKSVFYEFLLSISISTVPLSIFLKSRIYIDTLAFTFTSSIPCTLLWYCMTCSDGPVSGIFSAH